MNKFFIFSLMLCIFSSAYAKDACTYNFDSNGMTGLGMLGTSYAYDINPEDESSFNSIINAESSTVTAGSAIQLSVFNYNMLSEAMPNYRWKDSCSNMLESNNNDCTKINLVVSEEASLKDCELQVEVQDGLGNVNINSFTYNIIASNIINGKIKLASDFSFSDMEITSSNTKKYYQFNVENETSQNQTVTVKVIRQAGQEELLFDDERSCSVFVSANSIGNCSLQLRFNEDAQTGEHSLKIEGFISSGLVFTESKVIRINNTIFDRNYSISLPGKSAISRKVGDVLAYGPAYIRSRGDGDCYAVSYKYFLKYEAGDETKLLQSGSANPCNDDVAVSLAPVTFDKVGTYKLWLEIDPTKDMDISDNKTDEKTITIIGEIVDPNSASAQIAPIETLISNKIPQHQFSGYEKICEFYTNSDSWEYTYCIYQKDGESRYGIFQITKLKSSMNSTVKSLVESLGIKEGYVIFVDTTLGIGSERLAWKGMLDELKN